MMDAVNDPTTHTVVIMTSAQIGKTEAINNIIAFYVCYEPSPMLNVQPTVEMAETWSKDRLAPMIRDTPALKMRMGGPTSRASGNTMLHKQFPGGHITMAGANSAASLASRPIRVVLCDEVDRYPISAGTEGDPVNLARKRTATFWNRKVILTSTPTIKGMSRIESEFEMSDKRRYFVPCPHCGEMQSLKWSNVVFDKADVRSTSYACVNGCVIEESHKQWMLANGEWKAELPFNGRAGFHLNELYSPWRRWWEIVQDFLEVKDNTDRLKTWTNTSLGETWQDKGEEVDHSGLMSRREAYDADSLPQEILLITAAADVQGDRIEALSQGWGQDQEHWDIEHKVFWGDPSRPDVWRELDEWLLKTYPVGNSGLKIACCTVDSGGHHTEHVYNFCKPRQGRRVFAIKGSSQYHGPIASKPQQTGRQRVMLYSIGTDTAKDTVLLSWLKVDEPGPGYIHFPHHVDDEHFRQLTAESRKTEYFRGTKRYKWSKIRPRNEILDLHVYNYAAYAILQPDIKSISSKRRPVEQVNEEPIQRSTQKIRRVKPRRPWASDI
jgi:phage terminase large subunit GpA-like protein